MYNKAIFKRCFSYKGRYWFYNIKEIPIYIKQMRFLRKHGYDEFANWETFAWFIKTMQEILTYYRFHRNGSPIKIAEMNEYIPDETKREAIIAQNEESWNNIIDQMLALLNKMDENNPAYDNMDYVEKHTKMNESKDEFFKLFSKHFYDLWD